MSEVNGPEQEWEARTTKSTNDTKIVEPSSFVLLVSFVVHDLLPGIAGLRQLIFGHENIVNAKANGTVSGNAREPRKARTTRK